MNRVEVRPLDAADVPACGELLAQRHRRHRERQPLLSTRYEEGEAAAEQVAGAVANEDASGAVALRDGAVVGFLVGAPKPGALWGPNIWVEAAGQAVDDPEVMRDLYAVAATRWVGDGRTAHYVLTPATDGDLVRAWFRLGFGLQHVHGIRELPAPHAISPSPTAPIVRRATRADVPVLARLDLELPRHQGLAPTFSAGPLGTLEESLAEWESDVDSQEYATFVAELDGSVIGSAVGCALEKSSSHRGPARPDRAGFLGFAAVFPEARGFGAGRALGEAFLNWAAEAGFSCAVTDWRATNLLSSRAWPALGFTESFLRLHRLVGY